MFIFMPAPRDGMVGWKTETVDSTGSFDTADQFVLHGFDCFVVFRTYGVVERK